MEGHRPKTRTELHEKRKLEMRKLSGDFIENYINSRPLFLEFPCQTFTPSIIVPSPYIHNPKIISKSQLDSYRRKKGLEENEQTKNFNCKTLAERIEERELLSMLQSPMLKIKKKIEQQREIDLKKCEDKFSKRPSGVHGEELPKFSEHLQGYWKIKKGYIENPDMKNKERSSSRPISEFCRLRVKSSSVDCEVTLKPGEINPFPNFTPPESEVTSFRTSSRSFYNDEMLFSRPASQMSQGSKTSKPSRAMTASEKPRINNKTRPLTASFGSKPSSAFKRSLIRSSGFQ
ncbi:hypothetical protein SteCoe_30727 [Stentor coeruleus]|uniref:Uncharacterized protein n=1 Tax=Stentor coeruleus TaxID=5963 RepID=A0A1R2B313_9CILI|nr:hypothetical protein SteCoe_30727 [Stentor coeruleus]